MAVQFVLIPFLLPLMGALIWPVIRAGLPRRLAPLAAPGLLGLILLGLFVVAVLFPPSVNLLTGPGFPSTSLTLIVRLDALSLLGATGLLLTLAAVTWLYPDSKRPGQAEMLALFCALPMLFAGNLPTWLAAMLLNDWGLFLYSSRRTVGQVSQRQFASSQLAVLLILTAAVLASADALDLNSESLVLNELAAACALAGVGMRLFLFPVLGGKPIDPNTDSIETVWRLGLAGFQGGMVLARLTQWLPENIAGARFLLAWAVLAAVYTGFQAWRAKDRLRAGAWSLQLMLALAFAVPLLTGTERTLPILSLVLAGFLGMALVTAADGASRRIRQWRLDRFWFGAGILTIGGLPLLAGFPGRFSESSAGWNNGHGWAAASLSVATCLALVQLWRNLRETKAEEAKKATFLELAGGAILVIASLGIGAALLFDLSSFGERMRLLNGPTLSGLARTSSIGATAAAWLAVLAPLPISFWLGRPSRRSHELTGQPERIMIPERYGNVLGVALRWGERVSALVRGTGELLEQHSLGWLVFAALWIAVWLAGAR